MADEQADWRNPSPPDQEKIASFIEQIAPQLRAAVETVSGDPLGLVILRHVEQFANILRLTVGCQTGGVKSELITEVLRAAVVYAHASLEEAIRDIARMRIDLWSPKLLDSVPLVIGKRRKTKIKIHDLLPFADKTVRETIETAATEWLNARSFTSLGKILSFLKKTGIDVRKVISSNCDVFGSDPNVVLRSASQLIERRHRIVHSQDYEHGTRSRADIDFPPVMAMLLSVWALIAIIIIEETRRYPHWPKVIKTFCEAFIFASPVFTESDHVKAILTTMATRKGWPYLNEDEDGAAQTSASDQRSNTADDSRGQPAARSDVATLDNVPRRAK